MLEIGSEFHEIIKDNGGGIPLPADIEDYAFTFSGRTALETVLKNEDSVHKAILPSYCCDSMIEPFKHASIDINFYNVNYDSGLKIDINIPDDVDVLLWCNYFGFNVEMPDLSDFLSRGGIIIEDITHSFFSIPQYNRQSNYLVASLRKWDAILCGGYCAGIHKHLLYKPQIKPSSFFLKEKSEAMHMKAEYLKHENENKDIFLSKFNITNEWLAEHYSGLRIDEYSETHINSMDTKTNIAQRKRNAKYLFQSMDSIKSVKPMFKMDDMNCPLFFPIVISDGSRTKIREKLIANKIYCPVHWPHPNLNCDSNLYGMELSLICDQRYTIEDMERMVAVLKDNR